jgi:hypothetical protein
VSVTNSTAVYGTARRGLTPLRTTLNLEKQVEYLLMIALVWTACWLGQLFLHLTCGLTKRDWTIHWAWLIIGTLAVIIHGSFTWLG